MRGGGDGSFDVPSFDVTSGSVTYTNRQAGLGFSQIGQSGMTALKTHPLSAVHRAWFFRSVWSGTPLCVLYLSHPTQLTTAV